MNPKYLLILVIQPVAKPHVQSAQALRPHEGALSDAVSNLCAGVFHTQTGSSAGALDDRVFAGVV